MKKIFVITVIVIYNYIISLIGLGNFNGVIDSSSVEIKLSLKDTIDMFINLLTFQVDGLPAIVSVLLVYIPNMVLLLVLIFVIFGRGD